MAVWSGVFLSQCHQEHNEAGNNGGRKPNSGHVSRTAHMAPRKEDGKRQENLIVASQAHVPHKIERPRNMRVAVVPTSHQVHVVREFLICLRYGLVPPLSIGARRSVVVQDNVSSRLL